MLQTSRSLALAEDQALAPAVPLGLRSPLSGQPGPGRFNLLQTPKAPQADTPDRVTGIQLLHEIPGRVRLRVPAIKRSPRRAREVEFRLRCLPGVQQVIANPLTGSVLILFDPEATSRKTFQRALAPVDWVTEQPARNRVGSDGGPRRLDRVVAHLVVDVLLHRLLLACI